MLNNIHIQSSLNGGPLVVGWRQDASAGNMVALSLTSSIGVSSYSWQLVGRPEGSLAGGAGAEPMSLGISATATFTADIAGTYTVECTLNAGEPSQTVLTTGVAILELVTDPSGRPLRLIGPREDNEDTSDANVNQGWVKMLNRWLRVVAAGGGGGGGVVPNPPLSL